MLLFTRILLRILFDFDQIWAGFGLISIRFWLAFGWIRIDFGLVRALVALTALKGGPRTLYNVPVTLWSF